MSFLFFYALDNLIYIWYNFLLKYNTVDGKGDLYDKTRSERTGFYGSV